MKGLFIRGLSRKFGKHLALSEIDFLLAPGQRKAVVGPNGAGKSLFGNLIAGRVRPTSGKIQFDGTYVQGLPEHSRVRAGIAKTFQVTSLFQTLTPRENIRLAVLERDGRAAMLIPPTDRSARVEGEVMTRLADMGLTPVADMPVRALAYGQLRLLELALTLALKPRLLILDEPSAGIAASDSHVIGTALAALPPEVSILLLEHSPSRVPPSFEDVTVLVNGRVLHEGPRDTLGDVPEVRALFRGHAS